MRNSTKLPLLMGGIGTLLALATPASALTLTFGGTPVAPDQGGLKSAVAGATNIDFSAALPAGVTLSTTDSIIDSGSVTNVRATPLGNTSDYLAVGAGGSATFTFSSALSYLGFYWGSMDAFNEIEFFLGATSLGTFSSQEPNCPAGPNQTNPDCNKYANFTGGLFDKVVFKSSQPAFEIDNVAFVVASREQVPEATPVLGLLALGGLGLGRLRKRKESSLVEPQA